MLRLILPAPPFLMATILMSWMGTVCSGTSAQAQTAPPEAVTNPVPSPVAPNPINPVVPRLNPTTPAAEIRASLPGKTCSSRLLSPLQPSQPIAVGRESYTAAFYVEGTATQPGFLTCGLQDAELGKPQKVTIQFGLVDELPPNSRATVAAYVDGKFFRSITLSPKQRITTWEIPAQDKKSLTLEVGCPGNCQSRVYFTQADLVAPAPPPVAVNPVEPPPTESGAQPRNPEAGMRRAENTLRMLWLLRGLFGVFLTAVVWHLCSFFLNFLKINLPVG